MVFEFCEGGNLKSNLAKNAARWSTTAAKLSACVDAANAIAFLHQHGYIHRDVKAENFFVGKKWVVKLGDFGEATRARNKESAQTKRMTILGTVAFMAPELVSAERHYTQSIDIYALGVTFWEIWTRQDPYDGCSTFEIYEKVKSGLKLELPEDMPLDFQEILLATWQEESGKRPTGPELVAMLTKLTERRGGGGATAPEEKEAQEEERVSTITNPILQAIERRKSEKIADEQLQQSESKEVENGTIPSEIELQEITTTKEDIVNP
jgi:serine/threonine protein kinase